MAHSEDKFDAEALPDPELNPLLNPLLAAHMGRWAEVYFTNPPEKRGQAVSDLLRELRNNAPVESASLQLVKERKKEDDREEAIQTAGGLPKPPPGDAGRTCGVCSATNATEQKFCGMCGATLQSSVVESKFHDPEPSSEVNWSEPASSGGNYSAEYASEPSPSFGYVQRDAYEPEWSISETELPHFAQESESIPYRYRLYIGVAVAVLLVVLVYAGWHGTAGSSGDTSESRPSRVIPDSPAPSAANSNQQPATPRNVLPTERPADRAASPARAAAVQNPNQLEPNSQSEERAQKGRAPNAREAAPRIVQVAAGSSIATEQSGAEELATAEKYLSGKNQGVARDNREAAQWLWKAVGKGNLAATMTLSDLYLRGDGVAKSCDQARLLLDAAAKKGKASAAERLRNLPAFGCQ